MLISIISTLNESVKQGTFDGLAAMLDVEVESALRKRIFDVGDNLLLDACFIVAEVLAHELPKLLLALLLAEVRFAVIV